MPNAAADVQANAGIVEPTQVGAEGGNHKILDAAEVPTRPTLVALLETHLSEPRDGRGGAHPQVPRWHHAFS